MIKVIGFELKKMVSRPGIYILAILLALLLCASSFIYNPVEKEIVYNKLDGDSIIQQSTDFYANHKAGLDEEISSVLSLSNEIDTHPYEDYKTEISTLLSQLMSSANSYYDIANSAGSSNSLNSVNLQAIHNSAETGKLDVLYSTIKNYLGNSENKYFKIAILKEDFSALDTEVASLKQNINSTINSKNFKEFSATLLISAKKIETLINSIHYPNYTSQIKDFVESGKYYTLTIERRENVLKEMNGLLEQAKLDDDFNTNKKNVEKFNDLYNEYRSLGNIYKTLFKTSVNLTLMEEFGIDNLTKIRFLQTTNYYSQKEMNTKYVYFIENNTNENLYASPLNFEYSSNAKANGYDYTYFTISLFSIVLTIFAVMFASYSIAGESKDGTMRFVAIRPVSRTSIIMGKFLAIAIMTFILLVFSSLISFIVGGVIFGIKSFEILSVIDSSTVFVIHPMLSLIIFIASIYLQLLVYLSIAMLLTSFMKSDLFAFVITVLFYIVNMMLPAFFGASSWLKFYPFTSLNLYAFAGVSTITSNTILGKIFTPTVYMGGSLILSIIFIVAFVVIFNTIAINRFKKREL